MKQSHIFLLTLTFAFFACQGGSQKEKNQEKKSVPQSPLSGIAKPAPAFDGQSAYQFLLAQTKFGPRVPGSAAHQRCLDYFTLEMKKYADVVNLQEFMHTGYRGEQIKMTNIISSFNLGATNRILLAAHWDSRPYADHDKDKEKRNQPILGANDGASGVAVLLELAQLMKQSPPPIGVDIIFFDGEDFGKSGDLENYLLGSKYFTKNKAAGFNPRLGILLDMVGDQQLEIPKEKNSLKFAPEVVQYVWSIAEELGISQFSNREGDEVYDDHVPLNEAGIKTIDLIDFAYPDESNKYWHSTEDTPDKCSPESLEAVGKVLTYLLYSKPI